MSSNARPFKNRKPKKQPRLYDPGTLPQVHDPIGAVVHGGQNPDAVFAQVRTNDDVRYVGTKVADRPIDYLAFRLPQRQRISQAQYMAAMQFLADANAVGRFGSNTGNIVRHLESAYPLSQSEREELSSGKLMRAAAEDRPVKQDDLARVYTVMRINHVKTRLDRFDYALIVDLVVREYPVGVIAQRVGVSPESASALVRVALWRLVSAMEVASTEFSAWMATQRTAGGKPDAGRPDVDGPRKRG